MDFMNRSDQAQPAHQPATPVTSTNSGASLKDKGGKKKTSGKLVRTGVVALLFALTILVVSVIGVLVVGDSGDQGKFVKPSNYQAVFLTNGQVYFGKLNEVGKDYFRLQDIFYLTQNTTTTANGQTATDGNYTLVKLGCQQIHDPLDEMLIERGQVSFWENLQDSGKVVTSIKTFIKQNPKGPDCTQVSNQTQASSNSSSTTGTNSSTTPTTNTTTTKNP